MLTRLRITICLFMLLLFAMGVLGQENIQFQFSVKRGESANLQRLAFSHDGRYAVQYDFHGGLVIVDLFEGIMLPSIPMPNVEVWKLALTPDDAQVVAHETDKRGNSRIVFRRFPQGEVLKTLPCELAIVKDIFFLDGGSRVILSGSIKNSAGAHLNGLVVVDGESGEIVDRMRADGWNSDQGFSRAALHPDQMHLLISGKNTELKWVGWKDAAVFNDLYGHAGGIEDVFITQDGRYGLVADWAGMVRIWDLASMLNVRTLVNEDPEDRGDKAGVTQVVATPDGKRIYTASTDHYIRVWDLESGRLEKKLFCGNWINVLHLTPDGKTLYAKVLPYLIGYDSESLTERFRFDLLKDGNWAFITANGYYNGSDGVLKYMKAVVDGKEKNAKKYAMARHDPKHVAAYLGSGAVTQERTTDLAEKEIFAKGQDAGDRYAQYAHALPVDFDPVIQQGHLEDCYFVFDPTGQLVISSTGRDGEIKIWSIQTGALLKTFDKQTIQKNAVGDIKAVSPDGKLLVSAVLGEVLVWDLEQFKLIWSFKVTDGWVAHVAFHPNGREIVTSCERAIEPLRIWDARTGQLIRLLAGEYGAVRPLLDASGQYVYCRAEGVDHLWRYDTGGVYSGGAEQNGRVVASVHEANPDLNVTVDQTALVLKVGGKRIDPKTLPDHSLAQSLTGEMYRAAYEPREQLVGIAHRNRILLASTETGVVLRILEGERSSQTPFLPLPGNQGLLLTGRNGTMDLLPFDSFHFQDHPPGYPERIGDFVKDPSGRYLVSKRPPVRVWDREQARWTVELGPEVFGGADRQEATHHLRGFDAKANAFITCFKDYSKPGEHGIIYASMAKWSLASGQRLKTTGPFKHYILDNAWNTDRLGQYFATDMYGEAEIWDSGSMKPRHVLELPWQFSKYFSLCSFFFDSKGQYFAAGGYDAKIRLWTLRGQGSVFKGKNPETLYTLEGHWRGIQAMAFHPTQPILASGGGLGNLILWDLNTGEKIKNLVGHSGNITQLAYSPDGRYLFSRGSSDGVLNIWRTDNDERVSILVSGQEWIMFTPDGFFDASRNGGDLIRLRKGRETFGVDQFALRNNRPDIIMKRMGLGSEEAVNHYYAMFQRRLRRMGMTEDQLQTEFKAPEVRLLASDQEGKALRLRFTARDEDYPLRRYNIYINDVPLFGAYGKETEGQEVTLEESVELNAGENKVEVACTNAAGVESFRVLTSAKYEGDVHPDLYYLGFGVSRYANPELNLSYAHKDALDLASAFQRLEGQFGRVHVKTFTDEAVTVENIKTAKSFLDNAKADDVFVLFIAGHGMYALDQDATYYYLTHNADLARLSETAADFELIEDLMQGIKPRKKLFLMDTCESGEIEEETQNDYYALADARGIKARTTRGVTIRKRSEAPKRSYLYQKDRYIYNDLLRRSGGIVFSSSRGGEFSYESDVVQNGFFTDEILKCLTQGVGDTNGDGVISSDELRTQVAKAVAEATGNAQHPTVDRDNIYQKVGLPVIR